MPIIKLHTEIKANKILVFDLARSIDLHTISTAHTYERAIGGRTSGLIAMNETVTWRAKHFGITQTLTSKITEFNRPYNFSDEMINGAFKRFKHEHLFADTSYGTLMTDIFDYESPLGVLGKLADFLFLKKYMSALLTKRCLIIKKFAETEKWKAILLTGIINLLEASPKFPPTLSRPAMCYHMIANTVHQLNPAINTIKIPSQQKIILF